MSMHKPNSGRYVNYITYASSDVGAVHTWPTANEDSLATLSRNATLIVDDAVAEEDVVFPDVDATPASQGTVKNQYDADELEAVDREAFLEWLKHTTQQEDPK